MFNFTLRPGINLSSLNISNDQKYYKEIDFGSKLVFSVGAETEFIMPFKKNKWAVTFEPNYQYFKSSVTKISNHYTGEEITASIWSWDLVLGITFFLMTNQNFLLIYLMFSV